MKSDEAWRQLIAEAGAAWRDGRAHDALQLADRAALMGSEARRSAAMFRGHVLLHLDDAAGALSCFESVADPQVADPELDCARGLALFELVRLAESENALHSALRGNPNLPDAHYALGLIAEMTGGGHEVEYFRRARQLAPARFPLARSISHADFESAVDEAVQGLPEAVREGLKKLPLLVAETPEPADLQQTTPPTSPLARGMHVHLVTGADHLYGAPTQPGIVLFKRNLERVAAERASLVEQIRGTILEEAAHLLNLPLDESSDSHG